MNEDAPVSLEEDGVEAPQAAITPKKLLSKLCFARFGQGLEEKGGDLLVELQRHLKTSEHKLVTRQAVQYWLKKNSVPSRNAAFIFLQSYLLEDVTFPTFDKQSPERNVAAQKKVYNQLLKFFKMNIVRDSFSQAERESISDISRSKHLKVFMSGYGRVMIELGQERFNASNFLESFLGLYSLYRMRFVPDGPKTIAQEIVYIFRRGRELRFRQWYLHDGSDLDKFEGVVATIGAAIWLIGATTQADHPRLRVTQFRISASSSKKNRPLRWGIMLTENPTLSHDPVSCRVLMVRRDQDLHEIEGSLDRYVISLAPEDLPLEHSSLIQRLICNNVTALSMPLSIKPASGPDGEVVADPVLRVSQETLDVALLGFIH